MHNSQGSLGNVDTCGGACPRLARLEPNLHVRLSIRKYFVRVAPRGFHPEVRQDKIWHETWKRNIAGSIKAKSPIQAHCHVAQRNKLLPTRQINVDSCGHSVPPTGFELWIWACACLARSTNFLVTRSFLVCPNIHLLWQREFANSRLLRFTITSGMLLF